ncbi:MAG TPA: tRNA dimethylallyltransferase, partial [Candidatus Nitrosocosmicus sp.]|nr:tRNA dimethylallyltransferase [Candidatus Nitrosocosmicus sp.]
KTINEKELLVYFIDIVPVWLYDLYDPKEVINAYEFVHIADDIIHDIIKRGKLPIIVGGTVFYIKSFLEGFETKGVEADWNLRNDLEFKSVDDLQKMLRTLDKVRIERMNNSDIHNKRRLIRAIEIAKNKMFSTGSNNNSFYSSSEVEKYDVLHLGLLADSEILKKKIEKRVYKRLDQGALEEIQKLLDMGYSFNDPGLNTNGYKQMKDYFLHKIGKEEAIQNWLQGEIDHARRQQMFLKKLKNIHIFDKESIKADGTGTNLIEKSTELVYKWNNNESINSKG